MATFTHQALWGLRLTHPEVGCSKTVRGGNVVGCLRGVGVVGIDVRKQGAHDGRHTRAHVLGRQAGKVTAAERTVGLDPETHSSEGRKM